MDRVIWNSPDERDDPHTLQNRHPVYVSMRFLFVSCSDSFELVYENSPFSESKSMDKPLRTGTYPMTSERLARLHRLALELVHGPVDKTTILDKLTIGVRTFYRDLETLSEFGMPAIRTRSGYQLMAPESEIEEKLPFPDPHLNFAEARQLATSNDPSARPIAEQFGIVVPQFKA